MDIGIMNVTLLLISSLMLSVNGYGTGAPSAACETLMPKHSVEAQTSLSPYSVTASATEYEANEPITVTVSGTFEGLLLQARKSDNSSTVAIGTFSDPATDTRLLECSVVGDSWTHANQNNKTDVSIMWNPPSDNMGNITFRATVAQEKTIFWMNVESSEIAHVESSTTAKPDDGNAGARWRISSGLVLIVLLFATVKA